MIETDSQSRSQAERIKQFASSEIKRHWKLSASLAITCVAVLAMGGSLENAAVVTLAVGLIGAGVNVWKSNDKETVVQERLTIHQ